MILDHLKVYERERKRPVTGQFATGRSPVDHVREESGLRNTTDPFRMWDEGGRPGDGFGGSMVFHPIFPCSNLFGIYIMVFPVWGTMVFPVFPFLPICLPFFDTLVGVEMERQGATTRQVPQAAPSCEPRRDTAMSSSMSFQT